MTEHDFTALVGAALKGCKEYSKVDWATIRADDIATYSIGEEAVAVLEETVGADLEQYCTNKEEVKANEERTRFEYAKHLRSCTKDCCVTLRNAREDIGVTY